MEQNVFIHATLREVNMTSLHIAILSPFALAFLIPLLAKNVRKIHTGWFVLFLPVLLFIYFFRMIKMTADGGTLKAVLEWIPSFGINFTAYVDGLGLLFALLITGIGSLVVLYSIYYLSKEREQTRTILRLSAHVHGGNARRCSR